MATIIWQGDAPTVAQVDTLTPGGTIEINDKFILTVTGEDGSTYALSVSATATTVTQTCADITTAWNASTNALLTPVTAANVGTVGSYTAVRLTADVAGVPFYAVATTTESNDGAADDQTFSSAATTANSSPASWATASNWSSGTVPVNGSDVYFTNNAVSVTYGLIQSAVTLTSLHIEQSYTGAIGTSAAYLAIGATNVYIGEHYGSGTPSGSGRIKLDLRAACTSFSVYNSASTATDTYLAPIQVISGANAITTFDVTKGKVGVGVGSPSETAAITTANIGYNTSVNNDAVVEFGVGCTLTTLNKTGGDVVLRGLVTTINNDGGELITATTDNITTLAIRGGTVTLVNLGTVTTYTIEGGTCYLDKHGAITTGNCNGGVSDWIRTRNARTITTLNIKPGATIKLDKTTGVVTLTNNVVPADGRVSIQVQSA